jgi:hypothetical protein
MHIESFEPFVSVEQVAEFLSLTRREVLKLTRAGRITGYPCSGSKRVTYKYRLSVVAEDMCNMTKPTRGTVGSGSPQSFVAKERENG